MTAGFLSFLGAFLLFMLQPLVAKHLTPWFGGGSQVWLTCMVFFQVMVLAGYGYAHLLILRLSPRAQARLHAGLASLAGVGLLWMWRASGTPLLAPSAWMSAPSAHPTPTILLVLLGSLAGTALLLTANSTLTQGWYHRVTGRPPYRLYALSNAGSLLGLLAYPFLMEPFLPLRLQAWMFTALLALYILLLAAFLRQVGRLGPDPGKPSPGAAAPRSSWVLISMAGSLLLMATTNLATTELSAVPLLWVLPLVLYLLTFILAFSGRGHLTSPRVQALLVVLFLSAVALLPATLAYPGLGRHLVVLLAAMFAGCLFCHARLFALKPPPEHLSGFYFSLALGGVLGGLFVGLLAPVVFDQFMEFPLAVVLVAVGLLPGWRTAPGTWRLGRGVLLAASGAVALLWIRGQSSPVETPHRDAYGMVKVATLAKGQVRLLMHGRTVHGLEVDGMPTQPLAYYAPASGVGRAMSAARKRQPSLRIGVLGLGVGNVLVYGRPGDEAVVYEISPKIIQMAGPGGDVFGYVRRFPGRCTVKQGDGRLLLSQESAPAFDILLVDAFSGGNFPPSLLTLEALRLYAAHIVPDGLLVVNTTNRLPIDQLVFAQARALGWGAVAISCPSPENPAAPDPLLKASTFVILAGKPERLLDPGLIGAAQSAYLPGLTIQGSSPAARFLQPRLARGEQAARRFRPWTDDWNCLSILALQALRQRGDI